MKRTETDEQLKKEVLAVFQTEEKGFFIDEIVSEVDRHYERYTATEFNQVMEQLVESELIVSNEEGDIFYLHN